MENDYDGRLKFMTLNLVLSERGGDTMSNVSSPNKVNRKVVGIAFWREVDHPEMEEWMDLHRVKETLRRHEHEQLALEDKMCSQRQNQEVHAHQSSRRQQKRISFKCETDDTLSQRGKRSMEMIRNDSITWIRNALNSCDNVRTSSWDEGTKAGNDVSRTVSTLTHSWIKIELLAIHKSHRHHHYGKLLLACVLSKALEHHESHAILHIAGSTSNIAARKLYETFGFVHLLKYEEGGPFEKPDGDLYVLGDIGRVLSRYPWDEMW